MKKIIVLLTKEKRLRMNGKMVTPSEFLVALYSVHKKLGLFFFCTLLANLFQQRYISSVTSYYKYLKKLLSEK